MLKNKVTLRLGENDSLLVEKVVKILFCSQNVPTEIKNPTNTADDKDKANPSADTK